MTDEINLPSSTIANVAVARELYSIILAAMIKWPLREEVASVSQAVRARQEMRSRPGASPLIS